MPKSNFLQLIHRHASLNFSPPIISIRPLLLLLFSLLSFCSFTQHYYPVKINQKWGLIDTSGQLVVGPKYEAIGNTQSYGYTLVQADDKIGILKADGQLLLPASYEEIKILGKNFLEVVENGQRKIINSLGLEILAPTSTGPIKILNDDYLFYTTDGYWGCTDKRGKNLIPAEYESIQLIDNQFFKTKIKEQFGLYNLDGQVILPSTCDAIQKPENGLFFYAKGVLWGATNLEGKTVIPPKYSSYARLNDKLVKLERFGEYWLFNSDQQRLVSQNSEQDFLPFSEQYLLTKRGSYFGLINYDGSSILPPQFEEIQSFSSSAFRVRNGWKWGIVNKNQELKQDYIFDFIAPARNGKALVKKGHFFGLLDANGKILVPPTYSKISISGENIKAFKGTKWTLFYVDERGEIQEGEQFKKHFKIQVLGENAPNQLIPLNRDDGFGNSYLLEDFEWFYDNQQRKWGLRRLSDGQNEIEPTFDRITIEKDLGFTIVGIEKQGTYRFDRTNYRFDYLYGIVNNKVGKLVTQLVLWDVRVADFSNGSLVARVVFNNGRHGLMQKNGKFLKKDFGYIGAFKDGLAKISIGGKISAQLNAPDQSLGLLPDYLDNLMVGSDMVDFTLHDQKFEQEAYLTCEDGIWGFIDTTAHITIPPKYEVAEDFIHDVSIVKEKGKWSLIDRLGNHLLPKKYDGIRFLDGTDNQILKLRENNQKYGLIDTLGQLRVGLEYDDIGCYREGRLAVKKGNLWGFVDQNGVEIIPVQFQKVNSFSEGLAAVKFQRQWVFIDKNGKIILDKNFKAIGNFKEGRAWVKTSAGVGYIRPDGHPIIPFQFSQAYDFEKSVARVVQEGKYGLIDLNGNFIVKPKFSKIEAFDADQLAIVRYGNKFSRYGIINRNGEIITQQSYRKILPFQEGRALVKHKYGYGFIDKKGQLVIPGNYSKAASFCEGRAMVQRANKCGFIDYSGKEVIPPIYSKCLNFSEGKAVVYNGLKRGGVIDLAGQAIIEPAINRLLSFEEGIGLVRQNYQFYYISEDATWKDGYFEKAKRYQHGIAVVQREGKWGIINKNGLQLISNKYDQIGSFQNGLAKVHLQQFMGLANLEGALIIPPKYEYITYAGDDLFRIENGGQIGYLHKNGNWIWPLQD